MNDLSKRLPTKLVLPPIRGGLWPGNSPIGAAGGFLLTIGLPITVLTPLPCTTMVLVQVSDAGFKVILPTNSIILNGFTFSTLDANGWVIQSFSVYFKVTWLPVFWTFESNNSKLALKSAVSTLIDGSRAGSGATV